MRSAVCLLLVVLLVVAVAGAWTEDGEGALCFAAGRNLSRGTAWRACSLDREDSAFGSYVHWAAVRAARGGGTVSADTVAGSVRAGSLWVPPFAWVAHLAGRAECTSFVPSVDFAAGFVAASYLKLEEIDAATGAVVATVDLGSAGWTDMEILTSDDGDDNDDESTDISTEGKQQQQQQQQRCGETTEASAHLRAARTRYKGRGVQCTLTVVVSAAAGVVEYGAVPVSPTTLAAVLDVRGYAYASPANRLRLVAAVAGAAGADCAGPVLASASGPDTAAVYSAPRARVLADGRPARAEVSSLYAGASNSSVFDSALRAVFGPAFTLRLQNVVFPPGAQHIVYSPVLGYGDPDFIFQEDSAGSVHPSFSLLVFLVVFFVVFVDAAVVPAV